MKVFYDCEFIDDSHTIALISLGMVAEDGREYYAQANGFPFRDASEWVQQHVYPSLTVCPRHDAALAGFMETTGGQLLASMRGHHPRFAAIDGRCDLPDCPWRSKAQMRNDLLAFCDVATYGKPEFWGYYSAYDHVALCQLFGTMMDLPKGWPMYTRDLKQWCDELGNPRLPKQGKDEHNALADARWNKLAWDDLYLAAARRDNRLINFHPAE